MEETSPGGIIRRVTGKGKVVLRVNSASPFRSEFTCDQMRVIEEIAEKYGSRRVHVTPRQSLEIPDICRGYLREVMEKLREAGLTTGSTGSGVRNIFTCSRWCLYNALPIAELGAELSSAFSGRGAPGKVTISISGCSFSCSRSRTSDIGIIGRVKIKIDPEKCVQCNACVLDPLGCQVDAIDVTEDGVKINPEACVNCGFCSNVCKPGAIIATGRGYEVLIGGKGGVKPRIGDTYEEFVEDARVKEVVEGVLRRYSALAEKGERIGDVLNRVGMEGFRDGG